jgi:hypothetical protein
MTQTIDDFSNIVTQETLEETKECKKCRERKPAEAFRVCRLYKGMEQGAYFRSECVECEQKTATQLREAKKSAPPKPLSCECCGKATKKFVPDHNHKTGEFRGWVCRNCNHGLGKLGDDLSGLLHAVKYLSRTGVSMQNHCSICGPVESTTTSIFEGNKKLSLCDACWDAWKVKNFGTEQVQETRSFLTETPAVI